MIPPAMKLFLRPVMMSEADVRALMVVGEGQPIAAGRSVIAVRVASRQWLGSEY